MRKTPDYLTRLFSEYESVDEKSPEQIEQEVNQEAEMLVKQQSNLEQDMYYDNRYFSDLEGEEVNDGIYDTTPEEDAVLEEQHMAELDPDMDEETVVFSDADGDLSEVEHYDEDGNPIHPEVVKQALYDEYLATQYYGDFEDDYADTAMYSDYEDPYTYMYADDEEDEDEDEESDEEKVIKQALYDEFMDAQTRGYSDYYEEPVTYFYSDDEVEGGEEEGDHTAEDTQELHENDETPAVEVVDASVKKQASIHQLESSVNKYL